ncbi:MAG: T9SS type A sorting domain-containing protein [Lewinellaceae bacterium]|nr:T9SS type A sorting domain-containing protein [Lewinellaceae bacterium]
MGIHNLDTGEVIYLNKLNPNLPYLLPEFGDLIVDEDGAILGISEGRKLIRIRRDGSFEEIFALDVEFDYPLSAFARDGSGNLWFGFDTFEEDNDNGEKVLAKYDGASVEFTGLGRPNLRIVDIGQDDTGHLWVLAGDHIDNTAYLGIYQLNQDDEVVHSRVFSNPASFWGRMDVSGNKVWVLVSRGRLWEYSNGVWTEHYQVGFEVFPVLANLLRMDRDGMAWLARSPGFPLSGFYHEQEDGWGYIPMESLPGVEDGSTNKINAMEFDEENNLLAATDFGLLYYKDGEWSSLKTTENHFLDYELIDIAAYKDTMWLSSSGGVSKLYGTVWKNYTSENSILSGDINEIEYDSVAHCLWAHSLDRLFKLVGDQWSEIDLPFEPYIIYELTSSQDGRVWFGDYENLIRYDGASFFAYNVQNSPLQGSFIDNIAFDGQNIWVQNMDTHPYATTPGIFKVENDVMSLFTEIEKSTLKELKVDRDGVIWAIKGLELRQYRDGNWVSLGEIASYLPVSQRNTSFCFSEACGVIIGSKTGINIYRDGEWLFLDHTNSPLDYKSDGPLACDGKKLIVGNDGLKIFYDCEALLEQLVNEEPAPEKEEERIISLFPNPATAAMWLKTSPGGFPSGLLAEAYDLSGRIVLEQQLGPASLSSEIPVGNLAKGVYFMVVRNLESKEVVQRFKFVKY